MTFWSRVKTIYFKELIDIVRDHRTLVAMIVVPIVLYPLLMVGSLQVATIQVESLEQEPIVVGVTSDEQWDALSQIIHNDTARLEELRSRSDPDDPEREDVKDLTDSVCRVVPDLKAAVKDRTAHVGIELIPPLEEPSEYPQILVRPYYDPEEIHSATAWKRFAALFERYGRDVSARRLAEKELPEVMVEPVVIDEVTVTTPGSVLGLIVPLILVLMTITGAIYPAIDLTAGERERGTLETLMVCPVPVIDLVTGKFLVVTTVAMIGAALNLASISATVYFGGFQSVLGGADEPFPFGVMPVILLSLLPFAVLFSAVMIAVCSCARTFKEAQNYVTPLIMAALLPAGLAAMPATRLEGTLTVVPVGNMVLLTRDLLLGKAQWGSAIAVLLSTSFYAAAAVMVAARVYGKESVMFADTGSWKTAMSRRLIRPSQSPNAAVALLITAVLFPIWFYVQSILQPESADGFLRFVTQSAWAILIVFTVVPVALCWYLKIDLTRTFAFSRPRIRYVLAAMLMGLGTWAVGYEIVILQSYVIPIPEEMLKQTELMGRVLTGAPLVTLVFLLAIVPGFCEEMLFRGFLLSGLRASAGKWTAILVAAVVFAAFHMLLPRFAISATLGILLGYLCWQSRSLWPGIILHIMHNCAVTTQGRWLHWLAIPETEALTHLPWHIIMGTTALVLLGLLLARHPSRAGGCADSSARSPAFTK